ncbi:NAD(P)-dependent oxidoreductase [Advenella mimigardefordensis]|uniref:Putative NAD-binding 6-phosphopgluconate dehydrogenase n=1 Tax=Advenella mimigardefordensis (strain DSM 17166 / LMG 22922 / DPN7) TaxID=1247726 RepID=W0PF07_ADVMD|nr:NAD(P)-dependent oxidoreductase [Advenella mimigardefordensis]AHG64132.1 putative NAD-binding 6-phosphopgluconate dehydrogenase [Advenella mimigardefordensis DPN7]
MNIGYIGLGAMGGALARHLLNTHQLTVWDINPEASAAFGKLGATVATSAADLANRCEIILLCMPRSSDVDQVVFGSDGLGLGLREGHLIIDQTSGLPEETQRISTQLAGKGIAMVDAPVSGGVAGAEAGTITIMVSGADADVQKARPVLDAISTNVICCGSKVGDAQAMKLINNMLSAGLRVATLEIVAMGKKMGLSLESMTDVINKGSGRNRTSKVMLNALVQGTKAKSNFAMSLMLKDLNQAIQLGVSCKVPTTITRIARGLLQIGVSTLGEKAQLDQLLGVIESMADTKIADAAPSAQKESVIAGSHAADEGLRVGYVGLGTMGGALARRLLLAQPVTVYDTQAQNVSAMEQDGAVAAADLPALARSSNVIFICVPTSAIVREVIFGENGLAEGLTPGTIIVDQTTGDPSLTRSIALDLEKIGVTLVDAPVSGGPRGAVAGTIAIMCGGPAASYDTVKPILEHISPNLVYCGQTGNGHSAKLINNAVAACNRLLTYEAASLAVRYGLKLSDVADIVNSSTGWNGHSERVLPALSEGRKTADFQLQLMVKDLNLAGRMAIDCGAPMLIASVVTSLYETGANSFGGSANLDAMAGLFEKAGDFSFAGA